VAKRNLARDLARTLENVLALIRASSAQQQLMECFAESSACYVLANDTSLVPPLVGRLQRQLERTKLFNENVLLRVSMALREALVNAIEHGNLEVSSSLRERDDDSYLQELRRRRELDPYRSRRVMLSARETRESVTYVVRDEGPGYNVAALPDPTDPRNLEKCSGRGLLLIRAFMDEVSHNKSGNEITLIKRRDASN
jgi:anti-sigma regulatory factor (Ser/Thr protein kinase)